MFNHEMFSSPDNCIKECDKQINLAQTLITYLEQYVQQMESMKLMATSAKSIQEINPLNMMKQFMDYANLLNTDEDKKK